MIKIENTDVYGFEAAIRGMMAKGYRKTKTGYEAFVSVKSHTKMQSSATLLLLKNSELTERL